MDAESGTIWLVVTQLTFQMHLVALICSDLSGQYFSCLDKFDQLPGSLVAVSLRSYYFAFFVRHLMMMEPEIEIESDDSELILKQEEDICQVDIIEEEEEEEEEVLPGKAPLKIRDLKVKHLRCQCYC